MNFNEVEVTGGFEKKYMEPGVEVVKLTLVTSGESTQKKSPYVELTFENENKQTVSKQYYLNEGKAFEISAQTFFKFIAAAYKLDLNNETEKATVKGKLGNITSKEELATKLSTILVGKPIAMVIKGEWVNPTDAAKKPYIKSVPSNIVTTVDKVSTLKYDATKHISGEPVTTTESTPETPVQTNW